MAKEKIKVSVIIDKEAVKNIAFSVAESAEEYREVEKVIDNTDELVRDHTSEKDEEIVKKGNNVFGRLGLDILLCENEDLAMSKKADKPMDNKVKSGSVFVELTGEQAKELVDKLESLANDK